ncbi:MAG: ABC transporter permease [Erysipelotrichaceae bacterium]|nr:ABC transporter permease [Erysipelotrichaceae bacterium]
MTDNRFEFVDVQDNVSEHISAPTYSYWGSVFKKFFSSKLAITMLVISGFVVLMAIIQPMFSGYDPMVSPNINNHALWFNKPNATYWFGTDDMGNSLFDAVWAGTRNSLFIATVATIITTTVGVIVGLFWGYSKKVDAVMIEVYNIISNIPTTLIAMIMVYALGGGIPQLIFALCVTSWIGTAYFIRVQTMIIRDREYNMASRCLGTPVTKIVFNNVLPYLISVIMTAVSRDVPSFISYEVFLSYLGVGLSFKQPSLGKLISGNSPYMTSSPYLFWIPLAISAILSVSLYIVGQKLADASDPRTHMN